MLQMTKPNWELLAINPEKYAKNEIMHKKIILVGVLAAIICVVLLLLISHKNNLSDTEEYLIMLGTMFFLIISLYLILRDRFLFRLKNRIRKEINLEIKKYYFLNQDLILEKKQNLKEKTKSKKYLLIQNLEKRYNS